MSKKKKKAHITRAYVHTPRFQNVPYFFCHAICLRKLCICPGIVILLFLILCGKKYDTQLSFFSREQYNLNDYFSLGFNCTFSFFLRYLLYMHPWKLLSSFSEKKNKGLICLGDSMYEGSPVL